MLSIDVDSLKVSLDYDGNITISCRVCAGADELKTEYDKLHDKKLSATFKIWRGKRSLDANAFFWVVCDRIAKVLKSSKEEVYRGLVRDVGVFQVVPIANEAVDTFQRMWSERGLGWFADDKYDSRLPGYKKVFIYFGSSSYDTEQMSRLIDEAIKEAEGLGIPTLPPADIKKIKEEWREKTSDDQGV